MEILIKTNYMKSGVCYSLSTTDEAEKKENELLGIIR